MTFRQFEKLFISKYPTGEVFQHGTFGGTERNNKVAVVFNPNSKVYEYYGSYQTILLKCGINVLYKSDVKQAREHLADLKAKHGTEGFFGFVFDYTDEIKEYEEYLKDIENGVYIII